ncbi:hypothetical protein FEM33_23975 [Dyadobacter flavalbus]|uniref:Uncharacterized protein n=1 Tax=Dyadobacter flavalbus TaxID=2579942 RepID=A0A5M8QEE9_9BACT|nr:hypothetical protein [Dyadobacter flavalbus]KAA6432772.1 hypothetical protein FEM33_23975 [Dyadobacter flavalbus]
MKIGEKLLKELSKKYEPDRMVSKKFGRYDIAFKTDDDGNPILLFIGNENPEGKIIGQRFGRVLIKDKEGKVIKDHWDNRGKT